jgi:hypothetical protein
MDGLKFSAKNEFEEAVLPWSDEQWDALTTGEQSDAAILGELGYDDEVATLGTIGDWQPYLQIWRSSKDAKQMVASLELSQGDTYWIIVSTMPDALALLRYMAPIITEEGAQRRREFEDGE